MNRSGVSLSVFIALVTLDYENSMDGKCIALVMQYNWLSSICSS